MSRVFANGSGDRGSIPDRVLPKTQKLVLDAVLLNTQHYKVRIKGKMEQSREWGSTLLHLGVVAIEKGAFWSPLLYLPRLIIILSFMIIITTMIIGRIELIQSTAFLK